MKKTLLVILILTLCGCEALYPNRFVKQQSPLYFGKYSGDYDEECKKKDFTEHHKPYANGVNPNRYCTHYREFACRINTTCKDDEECKKEARRYWGFDENEGGLLPMSKACANIQTRCDNAKPGDASCLHNQEVLKMLRENNWKVIQQ